MEKVVVSGIAYNKQEAKITVTRVADRPGIAGERCSGAWPRPISWWT